MEFSLSRFWLLIRKQWVENRKLYLLGLLAMCGLISFFIGITSFQQMGLTHGNQQMIFVIGLLSSGALFASTLLRQYEDKSKSILATMLPASVLEKTTVVLLYATVFFFLVYVILILPLLWLGHYFDVEVLGRFNLAYFPDKSDWRVFTFLFLLSQSFFLLFTIIFRRFAFLKTVVLAIFFMICIFSTNDFFAKRLVSDVQPRTLPTGNFPKEQLFPPDQPHVFHFLSASPYTDIALSMSTGSRYHTWRIYLPSTTHLFFEIYLVLGILILWTIIWFRLREKQI